MPNMLEHCASSTEMYRLTSSEEKLKLSCAGARRIALGLENSSFITDRNLVYLF